MSEVLPAAIFAALCVCYNRVRLGMPWPRFWFCNTGLFAVIGIVPGMRGERAMLIAMIFAGCGLIEAVEAWRAKSSRSRPE